MRSWVGIGWLWLLTLATTAQNRPNILWLSVEDISPMLSMYGDSTAKTPNLDRLASESLIFNHAYSTVGVCGPSRSSLITGMYPASIGTHHMRTGKDIAGWGTRKYDGESNAVDINGDPVPHYSAVIPPEVKCFTEYLRRAGYYCTNNPKTDYQFAAPLTAWDANGNGAHWKNRPDKNQPFFAVFNHDVTHESRIWKRKDEPQTVDPGAVLLPPYFPDTEVVRGDVARVYSNIEVMDKQIGEKLKELEEAGLMDNTIVFFFSDHGGPLPRGKREHYPSGLQVPMMVRLPHHLKQELVDDMISFVDFAPTVLSLAGVEIPEHMQGKAFLGDQESKARREYIFGTADRFDEFSDQVRSVISKDYVYVRNYHPELSAYKDNDYRKNINMMNEMLVMHKANKLNEAQSYWFRSEKTKEEFYDRRTDPHCLRNLVSEGQHLPVISAMRSSLTNWEKEIDDKGGIPEKELLLSMWPEGIQPKTASPAVNRSNKKIVLTCTTEGSSIAYLISDQEMTPDLDAGWLLYSSPIELETREILYAIGTRIGFEDSEMVVFTK